MRYIYITDTHIRTATPRMRTDSDYLQTCLDSLEQVFIYAMENGCRCVLHAGDFFDHPNQTARALVRTVNLLSKYDAIQVITTLGQHDYLSGNPSTYKTDSALGLLESAGLITVVHKGEVIQDGNVFIYGFGYDDPECADFLLGNLSPAKSNEKLSPTKSKGSVALPNPEYHIALCHASVGDGISAFAEKQVSTISVNSGFDLVLFGDIHDFCGEGTTKTGVPYLATGALAKKFVTDIGRPMLLADISLEVSECGKSIIPSWEFVEIESPPDNFVFAVEQIQKDQSEKARTFAESLAAAKVTRNQDSRTTVRNIGAAAGFSSAVVQLVVDRLPE